MPSTSSATRKSAAPAARKSQRKKAGFTVEQALRLEKEAKAAGLTEAGYIHQAVLACWDEQEKPRPKRNADKYKLAHTLQHVAFQVKKLGNNVNQLAHQANNGLVPITRNEVQYILNQHQMLMSRAIAAVERVLS